MLVTHVIKYNGDTVEFDAGKYNRWAQYADKFGGNWSEIAFETIKRLSNYCTTEDIHQTMIQVCLAKEDIVYSRIAARLECARIRKNMDRIGVSDKDSFENIFNFYTTNNFWDAETLPKFNPVWNDWYEELYKHKLQYWQIKQWSDKYSVKKKDICIESPHIGAIGIGLAIHGDSADAFELAKSVIEGKINLPTPVVNGCRNGDFDSISCCIITGGDTVGSIGVAEHIAYTMTAKKAGIGLEFDTRSIGDTVKGGRVTHLGKQPIYSALEKSVKIFTQQTRGGSATVSIKCIDPQIMTAIQWKTQRIDIEERIDKIDYSLLYNWSFLEAVIKDTNWYLFSLYNQPEVHEAFYGPKEAYDSLVQEYVENGNYSSAVKARDLLKLFLTARQETGRYYSFNVSRANEHTPFNDTVRLSNLCLHKDTIIDIESVGKMTIKDFTESFSTMVNPKVLSYKDGKSSYEIVSAAGITGQSDELYELEDEFGNVVKCTGNHLIHTENRGWVEAKNLTLDDIPVSLEQKPSKIFSIKQLEVETQSVYDITVPSTSQFFADNILVHNCQEIALPTKPYEDMNDLYTTGHQGETAFCCLAALNVDRVTNEEYEFQAELALRTVDILIDKAPMMTETMKRDILKRRSVGIGITGLAGYLYSKGMDYDGTEESLSEVSWLAERHYYYLLKASQLLAVESGIGVTGIDESWLPIDTMYNKRSVLGDKWEELRNKPRKHSVLVAHMPTESSSVFSGATNGLYPLRNKIIYKRARTGLVQYIAPEGNYKFAWDIDNITLSKYYSLIQDYTDQGISCDHYVVPSRYPNEKVPMSQLMKEFIAHAKMGNKGTYYVVTDDSQGGTIQEKIALAEKNAAGCDSGGCSL